MPQKSKKAAAVTYWSAAYLSFWNGVIIIAVTSCVLAFLLAAKRYL